MAACASAPSQEIAPTAPDANATSILERVKSEPSAISGGGMIYTLFVGQRFNARYDQKAGEFTLTDIPNDRACRYSSDGMLQLPENAEKGYAQYCSDLANNAQHYLTGE
jgi:hypothetical protein